MAKIQSQHLMYLYCIVSNYHIRTNFEVCNFTDQQLSVFSGGYTFKEYLFFTDVTYVLESIDLVIFKHENFMDSQATMKIMSLKKLYAYGIAWVFLSSNFLPWLLNKTRRTALIYVHDQHS